LLREPIWKPSAPLVFQTKRPVTHDGLVFRVRHVAEGKPLRHGRVRMFEREINLSMMSSLGLARFLISHESRFAPSAGHAPDKVDHNCKVDAMSHVRGQHAESDGQMGFSPTPGVSSMGCAG
jgi:hypothetical protein